MKTKKQSWIKAKVIQWLDIKVEMGGGATWNDSASRSDSGQLITAERSLQLAAVWGCVKLLSETVSTLPIKLYQKGADGTKTLASKHPLYKLITKQPNSAMTQMRFIQPIVASLCLKGNAFVEKVFFRNELIALHPLLPQDVEVKTNDKGFMLYFYKDPTTKKTREIPKERIIHLRGFGLDGLVGLSPLEYGKNVFGSSLSSNEAASKIFDKGLSASGFLTSPVPLNKEQRQKLDQNLTTYSGSKNAGRVMVLEGGFDYKSITINPETAQLLESRAFSIEEICRWFGVPPTMIGHLDKQSSWASSLETLYTHFLTTGLRPILINIEQEINRCLLLNDDEFFVEFIVEGLLRADSTGRANYYKQALQDGWMSRNEVRAKENLPPIEGGDKYTIQLNMTTLDKVGNNDNQ